MARPYTLSIQDSVAGLRDRPCHVEFDAAKDAPVLNEGCFQVVIVQCVWCRVFEIETGGPLTVPRFLFLLARR